MFSYKTDFGRQIFLGLVVCLLVAAVSGPAGAVTATRSIRNWVSCSTTDETAGVIEAFAAARNNAFTLVVDCPVRLHSGLAIDRAIFIDNGTAVSFTGSGKFIVDNMFHPAFVIANSSNIVLTNWNVEWDGSVSINPDVGGYVLAGKFVYHKGFTQPAGAFNDIVLTKWLAVERKITFNEAEGYVKPVWVGAVNTGAVFYITGSSSNIAFTGLKLGVPATAGAHSFLPMGFSMSQNWKSDQTVTGKTPYDAAYLAVPHGLTFSGVTLDGTLMGWQGNVQDAMFENITSLRYADLQAANGGYVGGINKWFPPPHLFYLNHTIADDAKLYNTNIHFDNVNDVGPRLGVARDKGGTDSVSGYAASLKLGCSYCSVDNYKSARPDGFMDLLPSAELSVSNVVATFNSKFLNDAFPAGLRFPGVGYSHVTFDNVQMTDLAADTEEGLLGNAPSTTNVAIVFSNFKLNMTRWAGLGYTLPLPTIAGSSNNVAIHVVLSGQSTQVSHLLKGTVSSTLQGTPMAVLPGAATVMTWTSEGAYSCAASGAWSGSIGARGSRTVKVGSAVAYDFNLDCINPLHASTTALRVMTQ